MSKRSNFKKLPRDFYPTIDHRAITPKFIEFVRGRSYAEPCCGAGDLVDLLADVATCRWESDLEPQGAGKKWDAMSLSKHELEKCDLIITNPPFTKNVLLPMLDHFISLKPTWLLLPADLMHNGYFGSYMEKCSKVVSVGRLSWFKSEHVVKKPIPYDDLPSSLDKKVEYFDMMTGTKYYTGWWNTQLDKPATSEYTRGTDNYAWYFWPKGSAKCDTIFYGKVSK